MQRFGSLTGLSLLWRRFRYTQLFLGAHIETLSVPLMRLSNPEPASISAQPTHIGNPSGFASTGSLARGSVYRSEALELRS